MRDSTDNIEGGLPQGREVSVLLVEPAREGRGLLDDLLASQPGLEVIARVESARDVPRALRELPALAGLTALISMDLPGDEDALWLIRTMRRQFPTLRILAFGTAAGQIFIENAF